jgi:hypothetical protein
MAVRSTMSGSIARVRLLINDLSASPQFQDQDIQDVLDESRLDIKNAALQPRPTYSGPTLQYLDYYADLTSWEDDVVLRQYLTLVVTPSLSEPIPGHWQFSATTLPPIYISGKTYDVYRAAADLLERLAARWVLSYNISVDGQNLQRSQAAIALQNLAHTYRMKQRAHAINATRSDLTVGAPDSPALGARPIDYMASGDGR